MTGIQMIITGQTVSKPVLCEEGMNYPLLFYFHSTQFFRFDGQGRMKWSTALIIKVFFKRAAYLLMTFLRMPPGPERHGPGLEVSRIRAAPAGWLVV